ncbi:aldehyde dehydrogenase [Reticulomyxa filosa]|uniref:Aldehyde dehydrogenase n=1 Tax=Reticulomyxa filosa TaxID=46433 RepID=X6NS61_RETFI|nr:aldehyde dehydrogenase [Reticulomyxa filosa]|eukprot:ETO29120.1 aldehyde dehydrogenase [Reticulomyxa filosa]
MLSGCWKCAYTNKCTNLNNTKDQWLKEAINMVQSKPKPLACYIFSERDTFVNQVKDKISGGAIVVNDTVFHMTLQNVPLAGLVSRAVAIMVATTLLSHFLMRNLLPDAFLDWNERLIPRPKSTQRVIIEAGTKIAILGVTTHFALKRFANFDIFEKLQTFSS